MGVLQRFERRLEGLVEGTFARVFGGAVQPVEVAAALTREAEDRKILVAAGRVLVPNDYVVELGATDNERLAAYDAPLRTELAGMLAEHATEQGWSFLGPVDVRLEEVDDLATGVFRVRSGVLAAQRPGQQPAEQAAVPGSRLAGASPTAGGEGPRLVVDGGGTDRVVPLGPVTVVGRGVEADVRLADTGVSRRHAEVRLEGRGATVVDLGSTNGTTVNGRRIDSHPLRDGDRIGIGASTLVFRRDG